MIYILIINNKKQIIIKTNIKIILRLIIIVLEIKYQNKIMLILIAIY